ncbi:hypothetical protein ACTMTJ_28775 [Phytohabitans sp. LJ34]|uniref:hypothetical protein n=1 Tax=Phytohabitans sp. LJ34 TaxID=3452217 RepID=UPI003F8A0021
MVWPGTYKVMYQSGGQVQWATGERTERTADPVGVTAGGTTLLDEVLLPTGTLADDVRPDAVYPNVRVTTGRLATLDARL